MTGEEWEEVEQAVEPPYGRAERIIINNGEYNSCKLDSGFGNQNRWNKIERRN